jgi:hypothetical protein
MTIQWRRLEADEIDHELIWSVVGLAAVALAIMGSPFVALLHLPCAFKAVTGLPCPTCGATRAVLALLHGEWPSAFRMNPLLTLVLAGWVTWLPYGLATGARAGRRLRIACSTQDCTCLRILAAGAIAANWVFLILDGR